MSTNLRLSGCVQRIPGYEKDIFYLVNRHPYQYFMKCEDGNYIIYSQISSGTVLQSSSLEASIKLDIFQGHNRTWPV